MLYALLHFDVPGALRYNAVGVAAAVVLVVAYVVGVPIGAWAPPREHATARLGTRRRRFDPRGVVRGQESSVRTVHRTAGLSGRKDTLYLAWTGSSTGAGGTLGRSHGGSHLGGASSA